MRRNCELNAFHVAPKNFYQPVRSKRRITKGKHNWVVFKMALNKANIIQMYNSPSLSKNDDSSIAAESCDKPSRSITMIDTVTYRLAPHYL